MTGCAARHRQAGFTLLEMLVVVVVLGLLVAGLAQGVRTGLALWKAQSKRVGEVSELDATARTLRALLSRIAVPSPSGGSPAAAIKGASDRVDFVGDLPTGLGTTRRADIALELRKTRLVLVWTPRPHELSTRPPPQPTETLLLVGVERIDLSYWGSLTPDQPASWQNHWDGPGPPDLIRLRVAFAKGDPRRWPDLIAAPQL